MSIELGFKILLTSILVLCLLGLLAKLGMMLDDDAIFNPLRFIMVIVFGFMFGLSIITMIASAIYIVWNIF